MGWAGYSTQQGWGLTFCGHARLLQPKVLIYVLEQIDR
jgi:hypothetical protein